MVVDAAWSVKSGLPLRADLFHWASQGAKRTGVTFSEVDGSLIELPVLCRKGVCREVDGSERLYRALMEAIPAEIALPDCLSQELQVHIESC